MLHLIEAGNFTMPACYPLLHSNRALMPSLNLLNTVAALIAGIVYLC